MAMLDQRAADPDEPDFDRAREVAALVEAGYVLPIPIVERAIELGRGLVNIGWDALLALGRGTWRGWRAEFLADALVIVAEYERRVTMLAQSASWRSPSPKREHADG